MPHAPAQDNTSPSQSKSTLISPSTVMDYSVVKVSNFAHDRDRVVPSCSSKYIKHPVKYKKCASELRTGSYKAQDVLKIAKEKAQKKQIET